MVFRRAAACLLYAAAALLAARLMRLPLWDAALLFEDLAPGAALMLLMLLLASALLGGTLPRADRPRAVRVCLWALLAVHALLLVHVLFLSRAGLRAQSWEEYRSYAVNLRPFATVLRYVRALRRGVIPESALANLLGNLLLFVPAGVLLPLLFPPLGRFLPFVAVLLPLLVLVEAAQLLLRCGSCDVDDVILNLSGALAAWACLRQPPCKRRLAGLCRGDPGRG